MKLWPRRAGEGKDQGNTAGQHEGPCYLDLSGPAQGPGLGKPALTLYSPGPLGQAATYPDICSSLQAYPAPV